MYLIYLLSIYFYLYIYVYVIMYIYICIPMMLADYSTCCIPFQTMKPSRGTVGHLLIPHEITQKNPIKPDQP